MKSTFKMLTAAASGFVLGAVVLGTSAGLGAQHFMIEETLSPLDFDATVSSIEQTVTKKGWKLPKIYRLDKTMEKHGFAVNPVAVLELCHPDHAHKILKDEDSLKVTPFMPCRISVYQRDNGDVVVARMNSGMMSNLFHRNIAQVMGTATEQVEGIIAAAILPKPAIAMTDIE